MVRRGDIKLPDQSHQECLHFDNTAEGAVFSVPERTENIKGSQRTRIATPGSS